MPLKQNIQLIWSKTIWSPLVSRRVVYRLPFTVYCFFLLPHAVIVVVVVILMTIDRTHLEMKRSHVGHLLYPEHPRIPHPRAIYRLNFNNLTIFSIFVRRTKTWQESQSN